MTSRDFCFWLQGYFEITKMSNGCMIGADQIDIIRNHLKMVFVTEIDPSFQPNIQPILNDIHNPVSHFNKPPGPNGEVIRC